MFGPLDAATLVVGLVLVAGAVVCAWASIVVLAHWHDPDLGFAYGRNVTLGVKVLALLFLPALGLAMLAAAWAMAGGHASRAWRWVRGRRSTS